MASFFLFLLVKLQLPNKNWMSTFLIQTFRRGLEVVTKKRMFSRLKKMSEIVKVPLLV